jgi:hypothetical protein
MQNLRHDAWGESKIMKFLNRFFQSSEEGKGSAGCIFALVLMAIFLFIAFKVGPAYYNNSSFKGDVTQATGRIGARSSKEDVVIQSLIQLAEKNKIRLKKENIKIRRFSGQILIEIDYTVPVDLIILQHDLHFTIKTESFTLV